MQERDLFIAALEIDDPAARQEYLDKSCADDPALRVRIQRLLNRATQTADFLDHPAADLCRDLADELLPQAHAISQIGDSPTVVGEINDTTPSQLELPPQLLATQFDDENGVATRGEIDRTSLAPGTLFGRYRIECVLGSGGMGVVYLALDTRLDRQVALKIPRFDSDGKLRLVERFRREARVMASVEHRNLCPIINVDEHDGRHYLTMAYINGKPLSKILSSRSRETSDGTPSSEAASRFTARQIAEWIHKLALALDAAHRAGVVHRDLKPANVIIDQSGEPILMDFGLAWMAHETDSRVTLAGAIIGTPAYMSPEQAECEPDRVGAASDIYSLGVILYELLAGCPIRTGSVTRVLYKLMHETPLRPSEIRSGVDLKLEEICWKAIARRPADRFATAVEFAEALAGILPELSSGEAATELRVRELRKAPKQSPADALPSRNSEAVLDHANVHPPQAGTIAVASDKPHSPRRNRTRIVLASVSLLGILAVAAAFVASRTNLLNQETVQTPLTGTGKHLPLAPIGKTLAAVNPTYVETTTSFTGTWSATASAAWRGTFTAEGSRPVGVVYPAGVANYDFSGLANGVLPAGTYFTVYSIDSGDHLTLRAYDSKHMVISSPWLDSKPPSQWGEGSGSGFPGLPVLADMPGWAWDESNGTYLLDGSTDAAPSDLTIALSSRQDIGYLEVTRDSAGFSFNLLAPAAAAEASSDR